MLQNQLLFLEKEKKERKKFGLIARFFHAFLYSVALTRALTMWFWVYH